MCRDFLFLPCPGKTVHHNKTCLEMVIFTTFPARAGKNDQTKPGIYNENGRNIKPVCFNTDV